MNKNVIAFMCLSLIALLPGCKRWRCCERNAERREESGCRSCHEHKHGLGCEDGRCDKNRGECRSCAPRVGREKVKPYAERDQDHAYVEDVEEDYN